MSIRYEYLFLIRGLLGEDARLWTGEGDITVAGHTWKSTGIVESVTAVPGTLEGAESRLTLRLFATNANLRSAFLRDAGPAFVTVQQVSSPDDGQSWALVPRAFTGRLSGGEVVGDRYEVDVVDRYGDPLRPAPRYWSDEDQQRRATGDRGLRYMRAIDAGIDVLWP